MPDNARLIRNLAMGANWLMSHILHFYHLVALDYVDVNGTGLIPKGFLCPNYDGKYYARGIDPVNQTGGLGQPAYTVNNYDYANSTWKGLVPQPALGDLTAYFAGQYVRALKMRRLAHQLGAIFTGKMPHASCYTPGCVTTKSYNPDPSGPDSAVVVKVHELLYAGPGLQASDITDYVNGVTSRTHPLNGNPITLNNPHPESLLGFIGKPLDFWMWADNGFSPNDLPIWAQAGVPGADPANGGSWKEYTGTFCFDTVAVAHVFPEYFWIGSGYGRFLAWGIFEGADPNMPDQRLMTRGIVHIPQCPNGSGTPYAFAQRPASHLNVKEFIMHSCYTDPKGNNFGRHPWSGKTNPIPLGSDPNKYTYAKTPRYYNDLDIAPQRQSGTWNPGECNWHPDDTYLPYEVGPLARMINNAAYLTTPGGPATLTEAQAIQNGQFGCYYPGILNDIDTVVAPALGLVTIGVMPVWGANAANVLNSAISAQNPILYVPSGAISTVLLNNQFHSDYIGDATLDRIAARTLETYYAAKQMLSWFNAIDPAKKSNKTLYFTWGGRSDRTAPKKGKGAGLTEAPRGALGHWIRIGKKKKKKFNGKVFNYQIITPTAWNISPKDPNGNMGPIERCIWGTPVVAVDEPIEVLRIVHSFDPCCACTVHVLDAKKEKKAKIVIEPTL